MSTYAIGDIQGCYSELQKLLNEIKSDDYHSITKRTLSVAKECCDGKIVSILEGGYDLNALKESTEAHVNALLEFN